MKNLSLIVFLLLTNLHVFCQKTINYSPKKGNVISGYFEKLAYANNGEIIISPEKLNNPIQLFIYPDDSMDSNYKMCGPNNKLSIVYYKDVYNFSHGESYAISYNEAFDSNKFVMYVVSTIGHYLVGVSKNNGKYKIDYMSDLATKAGETNLIYYNSVLPSL